MVIVLFAKNTFGLKFYISIVLLCFAFSGMSQNNSQVSKKLSKQFDATLHLYNNREFLSALNEINSIIGKNKRFIDAYLLKADLLGELHRTEAEIACLEQIIAMDSLNYPKAFYALGNAQKNIGVYAKAKRSFISFVEKSKNTSSMLVKATNSIRSCDFALKLLSNPVDFDPIALGDSVNSSFDEYWPSLSIDGKTLVFTRLVPFIDEFTGKQFFQEDFFISKFQNEKWSNAMSVSSINTVNNEGAQSISPDASFLFFTACSRNDSWGGCDLYFSIKEGESWSIPLNAGQAVNSSAWESQPSVSANNEYLYFVSNREGGKGGMDIWRCRLLNFDGKIPHWGKAENLGDSINTPGNEMSPFMHPDGQSLYFASDYWPGMGGNDVFLSKMKSDTTWSEPLNIGYPINTFRDERGLVVDASGKTAYYSSNKSEQGMDIYSFEMPESIRPNPVTYVRAVVTDEKTKQSLSAKIELVDVNNPAKIIQVQTDRDGVFLVGLPLGQNYMMNVSASDYLFYSENFALDDLKAAYDPFLLEIGLKSIEPGAIAILRNVFFETGSFQLLPESLSELNKLLEFLNNNPSVKIEIGGHTDNVGTEPFNHELSSHRAEEVYTFLVENKIDEKRLTFQGYGFSRPLKSNETEEGRATNRRTEFRIVE